MKQLQYAWLVNILRKHELKFIARYFIVGKIKLTRRTIRFSIYALAIIGLPFSLQAFSLYFTNHFLHFNNADFENYDHETFRRNQSAAAHNTDDQLNIAYGDLRLRYNTRYKNSEFFVDVSRSGFWGADNYQGRDDGQNAIYFSRLYFNYYPTKSTRLTVGRYKYEIGNARYDYFFSDVIDGIEFTYQILENMNIALLNDIVSNSVTADEASIYGVVDKDSQKVEDFRGDTVTYRSGLNIQQSKLFFANLGMRIFGYHLRYAANTEGGADLSENGRNSYNKADGDYLTMSGARIYGQKIANDLNFDITYAYTRGLDRQFESAHNYEGSATTLNISWEYDFDATTHNQILLSAGRFEDGFASMKARSMGGMLLWGYKGYYAAPYAYFYHFRDYEKRADGVQYVDRTIAKTFAKLQEEIRWSQFKASLSCLGLWETRSGQYMGTEVELNLEYKVDNLKFSNTAALYTPTNYYRERAFSNANPTGNRFLPSSNHSFYGIRFSIEYILDLEYINSQPKSKIQDRTKKLLKIKREEID